VPLDLKILVWNIKGLHRQVAKSLEQKLSFFVNILTFLKETFELAVDSNNQIKNKEKSCNQLDYQVIDNLYLIKILIFLMEPWYHSRL